MLVYTLEQRCEILRHYFEKFWQKNHLLRWSSFWSWRVCKQAKLLHLVTEKLHAYIKKPTHSKRVTVWFGFWSVTVNSNCYRHVKRIFVHKNWRGRYLQHLVSIGRRYVQHSGSYTRCFALCFWRSHYQPLSWCHVASSDTVGHIFVGCGQRWVLRRQARDNWRFKG